MNKQKLVTAGATAALLLASVVPAFATMHHSQGNSLDIDINNSHADVDNHVKTRANSGHNDIEAGSSSTCEVWYLCLGGGGGSVRNSDITTGDAWASTWVVNDVNNTTVDLCGCLFPTGRHSTLRVDVDVNNRHADVDNHVKTTSNSGHNYIGGGNVRGSDINSGNAGAEAEVDSFVNTTVFN